jgi:hypothetical protein
MWRTSKSRRGPVAAEALSRSRRLKKRLVLRCNIEGWVKKVHLPVVIASAAKQSGAQTDRRVAFDSSQRRLDWRDLPRLDVKA